MMDYIDRFDVITLIYCDFGVLSTDDRSILLKKAYKALKAGGKLILDVFTPIQHQQKKENRTWSYSPTGGFWDKQPYMCLETFYRYDEDNTVLEQSIVINETSYECYNIWEHCFTKKAFIEEAQAAGFIKFEFYADMTGNACGKNDRVLCAVLSK